MSDYGIIDADGHAMELDEQLREHIGSPYRALLSAAVRARRRAAVAGRGRVGLRRESWRFKYVYVHTTAFPFELMIAMMHMIGEGVFDRFSRLRVGFMEGGAGWLPFWMERLDEHVEKLGPQMPNLRRRPSEIIRSEQIALTCESEESGLDRVLEAAGGGTVLYASDYCHWDCNFPDSVRDICEARDLSLAQKERILGGNAVEFFGLGNLPEPTAVKAARLGWTREESREIAAAQGAPF